MDAGVNFKRGTTVIIEDRWIEIYQGWYYQIQEVGFESFKLE
jgi:hypothetical protein